MSDTPITPDINVPRGFNTTKMRSVVPPGMGELNYIQMLLAGLIDQSLYTTSSPTFAALTLSGLTASTLVGTTAAKQLQSVNPGTSLSLSGTNLNTIQGIRTADSPTFTGLTLGSMAGILKAAAGVVAAATIGNSLSYSAPTLDAIQGIRTVDTPSFAGLKLTTSPSVGKIWKCSNVDGSGGWDTVGGMVYPGAGLPVSTGAAWDTSVANDVSNARKFLRELSVAGVFQTPVWDTLLAADIPDISATYVPKSLYDAQTILAATTDNTPAALTVGEQTLVGRITSGNIAALSVSQVKTLLAIAQADVTGLHTADSPTFAGATFTGLAVNRPVQTGDTKFLDTPTWADFKGNLAIAQADVSGLHTADSPTFAGATIGSLAGIVKAAAGVLSAQALGAADLKLFMNTAGNGIEWANGMKLISFTRDISIAAGTQAVTGVGFKGSHAFFLSMINGGLYMCQGFDNGVVPYHILANAWTTWHIDSTYSVLGVGADLANYLVGRITSWDSDGFTITWGKVGTPAGTCTVYVFVFR